MALNIFGLYLSLYPPAHAATEQKTGYQQAFRRLHDELWYAGVRDMPVNFGEAKVWVNFYQTLAAKLCKVETDFKFLQACYAARVNDINILQFKLEQMGAGKLEQELTITRKENRAWAGTIQLLEVDLGDAGEEITQLKAEIERLSWTVVQQQEQLNVKPASTGEPNKSAK